MITYNLAEDPNQSFEVTVNGMTLSFELRFFRDLMYATVRDADNAIVSSNVRCADRQWLIPFGFSAVGGNFRFEDEEGRYPNYKNFGSSCPLVFYTIDEIAAMS